MLCCYASLNSSAHRNNSLPPFARHNHFFLSLFSSPYSLFLSRATICFFPCLFSVSHNNNLFLFYFCPVQQFVSFLAFYPAQQFICISFPSHTTICFYIISSATHTTIPILAPRDSNFHSDPAQQFLFYFCPLTTTATPILQRYPFHFFPHTLFPFCPRAAISILFLSSHIICTHFLSPHNNVHPSSVPAQQFSYHFPLTRPTSTRDTTHVTHITTTHTICSITNTCARPAESDKTRDTQLTIPHVHVFSHALPFPLALMLMHLHS